MLGNAVSIRDSLLLTERGCVPSVGKTSALWSPPEPVFVVGAVGLQGAVAQRHDETHSITVLCPHCVPLVLARSLRGLPGAIGPQQCSGRAQSDCCWGCGDSREWSNDSPHQPCNYSPDGACVCET